MKNSRLKLVLASVTFTLLIATSSVGACPGSCYQAYQSCLSVAGTSNAAIKQCRLDYFTCQLDTDECEIP